MSAGVFLVILVLSIAALMLLIMKAKLHPVFSLFSVALVMSLVMGFSFPESLVNINAGFGGTLQSLGIPIMLGAILAMGVQDTGAAKSIANFFIRLFHGKNLELAPALTGYVVSIPVFGDITTILTSNIANVLSKRKHISMGKMAAFTQTGLNLTHAMVPPTPGILAVSIMLGADLGLTISWGIVVSLIAFFVTWLALRKWTDKEYVEPVPAVVAEIEETNSDKVSDIRGITDILGDKIVALGLGVIYTIFLAIAHKASVRKSNEDVTGKDPKDFRDVVLNSWFARGMEVALPALLITGMGGAFATVIKSSPAIEGLSQVIADSGVPGLLIPFLVGVIMMTAVGSMTTAGLTAAGVIMPMMASLGLTPISTALAIGAGTMIFNHVNNSGFWVISKFFNLDLKQGLKYITIPDVVAGVTCFILIFIFAAIGLF